MKILIVEDEEVLIRVLKEKFEQEGFEVATVINGGKAVSSIKRFNPDAILLDIMLPEVTGLDILATLKADDTVSHIPVIMMSNLDDEQKVKKAMSIGAVDYMVKAQHPLKEIVDKVNQYILKAR